MSAHCNTGYHRIISGCPLTLQSHLLIILMNRLAFLAIGEHEKLVNIARMHDLVCFLCGMMSFGLLLRISLNRFFAPLERALMMKRYERKKGKLDVFVAHYWSVFFSNNAACPDHCVAKFKWFNILPDDCANVGCHEVATTCGGRFDGSLGYPTSGWPSITKFHAPESSANQSRCNISWRW